MAAAPRATAAIPIGTRAGEFERVLVAGSKKNVAPFAGCVGLTLREESVKFAMMTEFCAKFRIAFEERLEFRGLTLTE